MKKTFAKVLAVLLVLVLSAFAAVTVYAVWNEDHAVQFNAAQYGEVPTSTLLIGTHLVHLTVLTDQIYAVAQQSAEESGQERLYYKSELADGAWFDITTAAALADITTAGIPVTSEALAELFLTHHTKADGITYDLRSGNAVALHNIYNPYELEGLEELFPLKNQYDLLRDQAPDEAKTHRVGWFFSTEVHNTVTNDADASLAALQEYYSVLAANDGGAAEMDAVQTVMSALDATRRAEVYSIASTALEAYLLELAGSEEVDSALQSAANDSYKNVSEALIQQQGKRLEPGTTTMSGARYEVSDALISSAIAHDHAACDAEVVRLLALNNIENGTVAQQENELAALEGTLLPRATSRYQSALSAGETAQYQQAVAQNSAAALLRSLVASGIGLDNTCRGELEAFIEAKCLRMTNADASGFVEQRLAEATAYYGNVAADAFQADARGTVDAHIEFLSRKKRALEQAAGGNELDKKLAEKADLQAQMLSFLDKNDLAGAKLIEQKISALDASVALLEKEQAASLTDLQSQRGELEQALTNSGDAAQTDELKKQLAELDTKLAAAQSGMSDGTLGSLAAGLKSDCLGLIGADATAENQQELSDKINTLGGLLQSDSKTVFPILKDLHGAMVRERDIGGNSGYDSAIAAIESLILDHSTAFADAMREEKSDGALNSVMDSYFSKPESALDTGNGAGGSGANSGTGSPSAFSGDEQAIIRILALKQYVEQTGESAAKSTLSTLANQQLALGNSYIFTDVSDSSTEYVPVPAIGKLSGMRFLWNRNGQAATLAQGLDYYTFTAYSNLVMRDKDGEKTDTMTAAAKFQKNTYIPEDYSLAEFGADAEPVPNTGLAVLATAAFRTAAEDLLALLLAA